MADHVTVLMLQAGMRGEGLDLAAEHRGITQAVERARYRDVLHIHVEQAVQHEDVSHPLMRHAPAVLHLSGRGRPDSGILLRTPDGGDAPINAAALCNLIKHTCPGLRLAIANSCWSDELAVLLAETCGCAIGSAAEIPDRTACVFAAEFYRAIAFGHARRAGRKRTYRDSWPQPWPGGLRTRRALEAFEGLAALRVSACASCS